MAEALPRWSEVTASPDYTKTDDAGKEALRLNYRNELARQSFLAGGDDASVTKHLEGFDSFSKPSVFQRAKNIFTGKTTAAGAAASGLDMASRKAEQLEPLTPQEVAAASTPAVRYAGMGLNRKSAPVDNEVDRLALRYPNPQDAGMDAAYFGSPPVKRRESALLMDAQSDPALEEFRVPIERQPAMVGSLNRAGENIGEVLRNAPISLAKGGLSVVQAGYGLADLMAANNAASPVDAMVKYGLGGLRGPGISGALKKAGIEPPNFEAGNKYLTSKGTDRYQANLKAMGAVDGAPTELDSAADSLRFKNSMELIRGIAQTAKENPRLSSTDATVLTIKQFDEAGKLKDFEDSQEQADDNTKTLGNKASRVFNEGKATAKFLVDNPHALVQLSIEAIPQMVGAIGTGRVAANLIYKSAFEQAVVAGRFAGLGAEAADAFAAKVAGKVLSSKYADRVVRGVAGGTEGLQSAAGQADKNRQDTADVRVMDRGGNPVPLTDDKQGERIDSLNRGLPLTAAQGLVSYGIGGAESRIARKGLASEASGSTTFSKITKPFIEGTKEAGEETLQAPFETFGENFGKQAIDPNQQIEQGLGKNIVQGAAAGYGIGHSMGMMHGGGKAAQKSAPSLGAEADAAPEVKPRAKQDAAASDAVDASVLFGARPKQQQSAENVSAQGQSPENAESQQSAKSASSPIKADEAAKSGKVFDAPPVVEGAAQPAGQMQNRDRARVASVVQMNAIANKPDYDLAGPSNSPEMGAPMASIVGNTKELPAEQVGRAVRVPMADGSKIPTRYAVVEADEAVASNKVDGSVVNAYYDPQPGMVRMLNNGRTAGLQAAYERGNMADYRAQLEADAESHGIKPEVIQAMKQPLLIRLYDDKENARGNMGKLSNTSNAMDISSAERATQDAATLDISGLAQNDDGTISVAGSQDFIRRFVDNIPAQERAAVATKDGSYSRELVQRVENAVFAKAYGDEKLISMFSEENEPDVKNVLTALRVAAPNFARAGDLKTWDVRPMLTGAIATFRKARKDGQNVAEVLAQQDFEGRHPLHDGFLATIADNIRKPKKLGRLLAEIADSANLEASNTGGLFGEASDATLKEVINRANQTLRDKFGDDAITLNIDEAVAFSRGRRSGEGQGTFDLFSGNDGVQPEASRGPGAAPNAALVEGRSGQSQPGKAEVVGAVERPALALTGQSEAEIRADEAKKAKDAAAKAAQDKAPPPDAFALTGSNRAVDVGAAAGQNSLFQPQSKYGQQDLFADAVPDNQRANLVSRIGRKADASRSGGIDVAAAALRAAQRSLPGRYTTGVTLVPSATRKADVDRVTNLKDAALATRSLADLVREHVDVLVTDAAGKIIAVQRMFAGATSETFAHPGEMIKFATSLKDAASFYVSHNHPSDNYKLSDADKQLSNGIYRAAKGIGPQYGGIVAVTSRGYSAYSDGQEESGSLEPVTGKHNLTYLEETIERRGYLGPAITSPSDAAKTVNNISAGEQGIVFMDAQGHPTGFFPVKMDDARFLNKKELAKDIVAASYRARASSAIIATQNGGSPSQTWADSDANDGARNIGTLLARVSVPVVDIINDKGRGRAMVGDRLANDILFKREPPVRETMTKDAVNNAVRAINRAWANAPTTIVLGSMADAPVAVQAEDMKQRRGGADGSPRGFVYAGKVYIVASEMTSIKEVAETLLHEVAGHYGLRRAFGSALNDVLRDVARLRNADVLAKARQYGLDASVERNLLRAAEEVLAEMAETEPTAGLVRRAIAAIRKFLRGLPGFESMKLSDNDIIVNYLIPARDSLRNGVDGKRATGQLAFNRATNSPMANDKTVVGNTAGRSADDVKEGGARSAINALSDRAGYEGVQRTATPERPVKVEPASMDGAAASEAKRSTFDQVVKDFASSIPINRSENESEVQRIAKEISADWSNGNVDEHTRTDGPAEAFAAMEKEKGDYYDADGDLTEAGSERFTELTDAHAQRLATDIVGPAERRAVDLTDPRDAASVLHAYLNANGVDTNVVGGSGKSRSKYFTILKTGEELRISDHELPGHYKNSASIDLLIPSDPDEARAYIKNAADNIIGRIANEPTTSQDGDVAFSRTTAATAKPDTPKFGLVDTPLRVALEQSKLITAWRGAFNLLEKTASMGLSTKWGETFKAGVVDKYGVPDAVVDRRAAMYTAMGIGARDVRTLLDKMGTLTRAEAAVLYRAATTADSAEVNELIKELPNESQDALREIKAMVRSLGKEQVRLGNMTADTFARNEWSYLKRSYQKYELAESEDKGSAASRALRTKGDQYIGRGMFEPVTAAELQAWAPAGWKAKFSNGKIDPGMIGQKFIRLEAREKTAPIDGENAVGKLKDVAYVPADQPIPAKYDGYTQDAAPWELRQGKGSNVSLWRDFTPEERTRMGEIDDIRYGFVKTMALAIHDTEVGKYFEWVGSRYGKTDESQLPKGAEVVSASERMVDVYRPGTWVQVPTSKVPGTDVAKYGKLSGLYIPGPIWNDIRQAGQTYKPFGAWHDSLLKFWKMSKTTMSPAVHTNNVMSNFIMADWAELSAGHLFQAVNTLVKPNATQRAMYESYLASGAEGGSYALTELQQSELADLLKEIEAESLKDQGHNGLLNVSAAIGLMREGQMRQAVKALGSSKTAAVPKKLIDVMVDTYQMEDTVFRLAAFIKAKNEGKSDAEAGSIARKAFLDYDISAPWVKAARATALPFVAFSYRAIPKLYDVAKNKPWKLLKLMAAAGALNAFGYMMSGGDEDDERARLAKEKAGKVWGIVPKLIRMPWNDANGNPVFLDVRRWIPAGDILDTDQQHGAFPIPPFLNPGGPLFTLMELLANKSNFTGKPIVNDTDTTGEKSAKILDHAYKSVMPNVPIPTLGNPLNLIGMDLDPGQLETYSWTSIANANKGVVDAFGRERSMQQALLSAVGVKVAGYPADVANQSAKIELDNKKREIMGQAKAYGRMFSRNGLDQAQYDARTQSAREKMQKASEEAQKRMGR